MLLLYSVFFINLFIAEAHIYTRINKVNKHVEQLDNRAI